jgi:uncharacterized membrane protein
MLLKSLLVLVVCSTCFYGFPVADESNPLMEGDLFQGDIAGINPNDVIYHLLVYLTRFLSFIYRLLKDLHKQVQPLTVGQVVSFTIKLIQEFTVKKIYIFNSKNLKIF